MVDGESGSSPVDSMNHWGDRSEVLDSTFYPLIVSNFLFNTSIFVFEIKIF